MTLVLTRPSDKTDMPVRKSSSNSKVLSLLLLPFMLTACLDSKDLIDSASIGDDTLNFEFNGCVSGVGLDASRIQAVFEFPSNLNRMSVFRNGLLVYTTTIKSNTTFVDTGLLEGVEYEYTCVGTLGANTVAGKTTLTLTTASTNAPNFAGISSVTALSTNSVQVQWSVPSAGPAAYQFKVYGNPGSSVTWTGTPRIIKSVNGTYTATVTGLGDELPYAFGVRACTVSGFCDSNTTIRTVSMGDGGAPQTSGATSVSASNGSLTITAPWVEANGAVLKRKVYQRTGAVGGTNIANYTLVKTEFVSDLATPNTAIQLTGIAENTTYHFIVQDEDPSTQSNNNTSVVSYTTGDLTAPIFTGITSLALGSPTNSVLSAGFTAIAHEGIDSNGPTYYRIYYTSATYPAAPANPCSNGSLLQTLTASAYAAGPQTVNITGLLPRTTYKICMQARDSAGNESASTANFSATTLDLTAPSFDGIQTAAMSGPDIALTWNSSTSSDVLNYKIKVWKNTASPVPLDITTFTKTHASYPSGYTLLASEYTYVQNDVVYFTVDACDDANTLPGGSSNCTAFTAATAKTVTIPDIVAPAGFAGVKASVDQESNAQSQLTVKWFEPTWTADYAGFKVYQINPADNSITGLLKTCPCATPGSCNAGDVQCTISGLDAYRTYRVHVRAYDAVGNETTYLNPATSYAEKRTLDTTAPTFSSGLNLGAAPTFTLNYTAATDNQYATEPGAAISYKIYRKVGATFATPTNPSADGVLRTTTTNTSFTDTGFVSGTVYYFTVCALDTSLNTTCDGTVVYFTAPDIIAPTISSFTNNKTTAEKKKWDLNWGMSDDTSASGNLTVRIYQKNSNIVEAATTADTQIYSAIGTTTKTALTGPVDVTKYVNYLLVVTDEAGNSATATTYAYSTNVMTITAVKRSKGSTAGGKLILLTGTGFSLAAENGFGTDATIALNGVPCTGVSVYASTKAACTVPAMGAGTADVVITNPEGSSATLSAGYLYEASSTLLCDNPGSWGTYFAGGDGSSGNPFIICNATHLDLLDTNTASGACSGFRYGNCYYKLGDNIDLSGGDIAQQGTVGTDNWLQLDGDGHVIANHTDVRPASSNVAFFGRFRGTTTISNIGFVSFTMQGTSNTSFITPNVYADTKVTFDNVFATGTLTGTSGTGGFAGANGGLFIEIKNGSFVKATITATSNDTGGFLGNVGSAKITISDSFADVVINSSSSYVGGIIGNGSLGTGSTITNTSSKGTITGTSTVGGIAGNAGPGGVATLLFDNVSSSATINGTSQVAGILANSSTSTNAGADLTIRNASFSGIINASASAVGGIAGYYRSLTLIEDSTFSGTINMSSTGSNLVGGLVGQADTYAGPSTINRCKSTGSIVFKGNNVGGIVGQIYATYNYSIRKSTFSGTLNGQSTNTANNIGGISGYVYADASGAYTILIEDSYFSGSIINSYSTCGGIAGYYGNNNTQTFEINRTYAIGSIGCSLTTKGGVVGNVGNTATTSAGNFWNTATTGQAIAKGTGGTLTATGKTTAEMQDQGTDIYTAASWDLTPTTGVWKWCAASGVYPILQYQTCP